MFYTYILKETNKEHYYVGSTSDIDKRLERHSIGECSFTKNRNWEIFCYFAFKYEKTARKFEIYLKSGSGRAFAKKHFSI